MTNNNAVFHCAEGSVVWVHGSVNNIGDSLYNLGHITICGNLTNNGLISGDGIYEIGAHWINNSVFKHGESEVIMNNEPFGPPAIVIDQEIKGTSITSFYDLTLKGVGIKFTTLNDTVTHFLNLNDRELSLTSHELWVTNTNPFAITRTEGFVSNSLTGWLYRLTSVSAPYTFPMGSSSGPMRYRPVDIKPTVADDNIYKVGFFNYNATNDNFDTHKHDTTICMIDSVYYHRIMREQGTNPVNLTIYYDEATDGYWNRIVNWDSLNDIWQNTAPNSMIFSPMVGVVKNNWNTWTDEPYALAAKKPDSVYINGPQYFCLNSTDSLEYNAWGGDFSDNYYWTVVGGHIVGNATGQTVYIHWDVPGTGIVSVQEITNWGHCYSYASHCFTTVYPEPIADFYITQSDTAHLFAYDLIHFVNTSVNAIEYYWTFGDDKATTQESPYHIYDHPGMYEVCLWINSADDCEDIICKTIEVEEGMIVPNVFTPNEDGFNDDFYIRCSGMSYFFLQVFDRWGVLVYESNSPASRWDGKSLSGELSSEGTYYYILHANSETKDYSQHGTVTLLR
ncbi:MAG TPA: gliding motility-associated C-terminal domain-containing protein [Bacteroidales bacterium]|nr:gliding motility-associated C-terminal domain-containing protein [Bacteroidales bacterium]HPS16207.1 gliding motility-associated C-terminal domain-containing protein [Bacteroidales bacterium]